jgi:hypothetical protein
MAGSTDRATLAWRVCVSRGGSGSAPGTRGGASCRQRRRGTLPLHPPEKVEPGAWAHPQTKPPLNAPPSRERARRGLGCPWRRSRRASLAAVLPGGSAASTGSTTSRAGSRKEGGECGPARSQPPSPRPARRPRRARGWRGRRLRRTRAASGAAPDEILTAPPRDAGRRQDVATDDQALRTRQIAPENRLQPGTRPPRRVRARRRAADSLPMRSRAGARRRVARRGRRGGCPR